MDNLTTLIEELLNWALILIIIFTMWIGFRMATATPGRVTHNTSIPEVMVMLANKLLGALYLGMGTIAAVLMWTLS